MVFERLRDWLAAVPRDYQVPFRSTSTLAKLTVKLEPRKRTAKEKKLVREHGQRTNKASE
jgi:hypothetical protein